MSKRCIPLPATICLWTLAALAVFLCGALHPTNAHAQARATIIIDSLTASPQPGDTFTVAVRIDNVAPGTSINALDLLIQYDYYFMRLIDVQPGALMTSCSWEYFEFRTLPPTFCPLDSCPDGKVRITSLADVIGQPGSPACFIDQPGEIALLTYVLSHREPPYCGTLLPIQFLWDDCGDNMVTLSTTLDTALISNRVFRFSTEITDNFLLPTSTGAPDECVVSGGVSGNNVRGVDYVGSGIFLDCPAPLTSGAQLSLLDLGIDNWLGGQASVVLQLTDVAPGYELGSFEIYFRYDPSVLTLSNVGFGTPAQCGYGALYYQVGPDAPCGSAPCPDGVVRIVGIASDLQGPPTCFLGQNAVIAEIQFQVAYDSSLICSSTPVDFIWHRCGENAFTEAPDEIWSAFARNVYDPFGFPYPDTGIVFPSLAGPADTCPTNPNPMIDFQSTSVVIPCAGAIDGRGDINLNAIAYEIADYVVFTNYFLFGSDAVFTISGSDQAAATDANADGVVLSLNDLVYLLRVITGDAFPFPSPPKADGDTAYLAQDLTQKTVTMQYSDSLTALYLIFEGEVTSVTSTLPDHDLAFNFDGTHTKVMITPTFGSLSPQTPLPTVASGQLLTYAGDATLIGAEASFDGLQTIYTEIAIPGLQQCCITRGNVDHDANQNIDIADATELVQYMFANGPAPFCLEEANINGSADGRIDVSDLIYLVRFMFLNGDPIPACPSQTKAWRYIAQATGGIWVDGLFTMTVDDPPFFAGEWFLNQLASGAPVGPQVGQGDWYGNGTSEPDNIRLNMMLANDQVNLTITNHFTNLWLGTWEFSQSGSPVSSGQIILFGL